MAWPILILFNYALLYQVLWDILSSSGIDMNFWAYSVALGIFCLTIACVISFLELGMALYFGGLISQKNMFTDHVQIIITLSIVPMSLAWLIAYEYFGMGAFLEIMNDRNLTFLVFWPITIAINIVAFEGLTRLVQIVARRIRGGNEKPKSP